MRRYFWMEYFFDAKQKNYKEIILKNNMDRTDPGKAMYEAPIKVSDAASMFRVRITNNMRPYTAVVSKMNNDMVDEWENTVLKNIADHRGAIASGRVSDSWLLFQEGKNVLEYMKMREKGLIVRPEPHILKFWIDFFENLSIAEMMSYGKAQVSYGFSLISHEVRCHFAEEKFKALFSMSDDPLEWEKNRVRHADLLAGKPHPFWDEETYKDIIDKVGAILTTNVQPTN